MADNTISGWAVLYNSETVIANLFRERVAPGAFDRSLRANPDVLALIGHDPGRVLGRTSAGTLELRSDRVGLYFSLTPDESTPEGLTAIGSVGRQDVKGCSFGFAVRAEEWVDGGDRLPLRIITDADLFEISLVAWPAYEQTSAQMRDQEWAVSAARRAASTDNYANAQRRIREDSIKRAERAMRLRGIKV